MNVEVLKGAIYGHTSTNNELASSCRGSIERKHMSKWYDEARRRLEQKQQQEEQQRLQGLQKQQQLYSELLRILYSAGALDRLEYIMQVIWGCGQIDPYQRKVDTRHVPDYTFPDGFYTIHGSSEAGLQLHFEYEVLKYVWNSDEYDDSRPPRLVQTAWHELSRSTATRAVTISAVQSESDGSIQMCFEGKPLSTPLGNLAALVQELDEAVYLYCQTAHSPLEEKARQDKTNQWEEKTYHRNNPRKRRFWF